MSVVISMNEVQKSFGKNSVLKGITGTIEEGKVVGLLGRNGEGKTTLFKILLDILQADSGEVRVANLSPDGSGRIRKIVGCVPERPTFHNFLSVEETFKLRSTFFPNWQWEKAYSTAKQLDLDSKTRIHGASKGTLAKVAWVCATAHDPKILLLDEPTSGLDALVRDSVLQHLVAEMAAEGRTILVSNHRMEELANVIDEIWLLQDGKIQSIHSIDDLKENACRINGRLRSDRVLPPSLRIVEEQHTGNLVTWVVVDPDALRNIRDLKILDEMETQPLPMETTLKVLLAQKGAPS